MNKIGVIGGRDSVLGFRALGLDTCIAENGEQAKAALHRMAKENYAIIYITEHLAAQIPAEIERRREDVSPAVILIPGRSWRRDFRKRIWRMSSAWASSTSSAKF